MRIEVNATPEALAQGMIDHSEQAALMLRAYADASNATERNRLFAWLQRASGKEPRANLRRLGELIVEATK